MTDLQLNRKFSYKWRISM